MRARNKVGSVSVHAIAGTHVVLFGLDVDEAAVDGLLGFAIERTGPKGKDFLPNFVLFRVNDQGANPDHSSFANPFQEFVWGDYTVSPGTDYTYRVVAMYGQPGQLEPRDEATVEVTTETDASGTHSLFFNRGAATSQAYVRKFGYDPPDQVPGALQWLSRGLEEGMLAFIQQANGPSIGLRAAVYEFDYAPVLDAFGAAAAAGADVKIVYDASTDFPRTEDEAAIAKAGIDNLTIKRTNTSKISHNKFVVLLRDGEPVEVWTGSTNVTEGGIYGQSNVGHLVRDPAVAASYLAYWTELSGDPDSKSLKAWTDANTPIPDDEPPANSILTVFSPHPSLRPLEWYAQLMDGAQQGVFLTAAFGVSKQLLAIFEEDKDYLRYLLLDKRDATVDVINRDPDNQVTAGAFIPAGGWGQWIREKLTGLNVHVQYIHTKYMLIDPLGDDPIVITGSANFSAASTNGNDENMLVIRGDTRVADVYLGEFMRLFTHFQFRGKTRTPLHQPAPGPGELPPPPDQPADATAGAEAPTKLYLREDDGWARRFFVAGSPYEKERLTFR